MQALVVYESMFGNTEAVARALADGLEEHADVELVEVGAAPAVLDGVDLLVVGAPTHAFGLSRPRTRAAAADQAAGALVSRGIGMREWLAGLEAPAHVAAAAFDTRVATPRWVTRMGTAGRAAERRLRRLGFDLAAPAAGFYVAGTPGPLLPGEEERARRWGEALVTARPRVRAR